MGCCVSFSMSAGSGGITCGTDTYQRDSQLISSLIHTHPIQSLLKPAAQLFPPDLHKLIDKQTKLSGKDKKWVLVRKFQVELDFDERSACVVSLQIKDIFEKRFCLEFFVFHFYTRIFAKKFFGDFFQKWLRKILADKIFHCSSPNFSSSKNFVRYQFYRCQIVTPDLSRWLVTAQPPRVLGHMDIYSGSQKFSFILVVIVQLRSHSSTAVLWGRGSEKLRPVSCWTNISSVKNHLPLNASCSTLTFVGLLSFTNIKSHVS